MGGSRRAEELGLHVRFLTDLDFWRGRKPAVVGTLLVALLRVANNSFKFFVEFSKIHGILASTRRREVALRVNFQSGVITFVGEERGETSSLVWRVIVRKFSEGQ